MTHIHSYTHIERELMRHYRDRLNHAESDEDIRKFFSQTVRSLLSRIMENRIAVEAEDAMLSPESPPFYRFSNRLAANKVFRELRKHSDVDAVLKRFAEPATKHFRHLRGHPEKTEAKIRHRP